MQAQVINLLKDLQAKLEPDLHLHLARPRRGRARQRPGRGHVPGQGRGAGVGRRAVPRAPPPVRRGAAVGRVGHRPRPGPAAAAADHRRRHPVAGRPAAPAAGSIPAARGPRTCAGSSEPVLVPAPGDPGHLTACHFPIETPAVNGDGGRCASPPPARPTGRPRATAAGPEPHRPSQRPHPPGRPGRASRRRGHWPAGLEVPPADELPEAAAPGTAPAGTGIEGRSPWRLAWDRLRHDRVAVISAAFILLLILLAIFAPADRAPDRPRRQRAERHGRADPGRAAPPAQLDLLVRHR